MIIRVPESAYDDVLVEDILVKLNISWRPDSLGPSESQIPKFGSSYPAACAQLVYPLVI